MNKKDYLNFNEKLLFRNFEWILNSSNFKLWGHTKYGSLESWHFCSLCFVIFLFLYESLLPFCYMFSVTKNKNKKYGLPLLGLPLTGKCGVHCRLSCIYWHQNTNSVKQRNSFTRPTIFRFSFYTSIQKCISSHLKENCHLVIVVLFH